MKKYTLLLILTTLFLLLSNLHVVAQQPSVTSTPKKRAFYLNLGASPTVHLNSVNSFVNDEKIEMNPFEVKNTLSLQYNADIQYVAKNGLSLNLGVTYNNIQHKFRNRFNFAYLNPEDNLLKKYWEDSMFQFNTRCISIRFLAGKQWTEPFKNFPGWDLRAEAGVSGTFYLNQFHNFEFYDLEYFTNDTLFFLNNAIQRTTYYGNYAETVHIPNNFSIQGYCGMSKKVNLGIVKNLSFGLEARYGLISRQVGPVGQKLSLSYYRNGVLERTIKEYRPKDFAIGLRCNIGLGKP